MCFGGASDEFLFAATALSFRKLTKAFVLLLVQCLSDDFTRTIAFCVTL